MAGTRSASRTNRSPKCSSRCCPDISSSSGRWRTGVCTVALPGNFPVTHSNRVPLGRHLPARIGRTADGTSSNKKSIGRKGSSGGSCRRTDRDSFETAMGRFGLRCGTVGGHRRHHAILFWVRTRPASRTNRPPKCSIHSERIDLDARR